MIARILSIWFAVNASYWFYPALFAAVGFVLGVVLVEVDRGDAAQWVSQIGAFQPLQPESASNMLTVLAGSIIGVAATVFAITIAAVAYASGTYGPRLLTNFLEDKGNQLTLATFIGTFVYAVTVLRTLRWGGEAGSLDGPIESPFVPQLSMLVAFGLMILSVGVLVYFLNHIPSSIRINAVLEGIGSRILRTIDHRYPRPFERSHEPRLPPDGAMLAARQAGYIRVIDLNELAAIADKHQMEIGLCVRTGDFLHRGKPVLTINRQEIDEELGAAMMRCFALGGSRTPEQDLEFSVDELVEIALRALSPSVNDPFTAIAAVHWLGAVTAQLGARDLRPAIHGQVTDHGHLVLLDDDFEHYVMRGFGAARAALASHRLTALVTFDVLRDAARAIESAERRDLLRREAERLMEQASHALDGPDLEDVEARHRQFVSGWNASPPLSPSRVAGGHGKDEPAS